MPFHPDRSIPDRPRVRAAFRFVALASAATILSACGMVAVFVPPLDVGDPLGVNERTLTAALNEGPITPQATAHVDSVTTHDLPDLEQDLHGFSLAGFRTDVGLGERIYLTGSPDAAAYPETVTITGALVAAHLSDVGGAVEIEERFDLDVEFVRDTCGEVSCSYRTADGMSASGLLSFGTTDRAKLDTLVDILVRGERETANTGILRIAVQLESTPGVTGLTATFTLTSKGSTIELGG